METGTLDTETTARHQRVTDLADLARRAVSNDPVEATITFALQVVCTHAGADSATFWDLPDAGRIRLAVAAELRALDA